MTPIARILRVAETSPERPALEIGGRVWSYRALITEAAALAERLPEWKTGQTQPRMLVAVERHPAAYIAILAAHLRGYAYVPIDPGHPHARNTAVLAAAEACCITSSPHIAADVARLLQQLPQTERSPAQEICTPGEADTVPLPTAADMPKDMQALAYILFTSGSTGTPKGVPISQGNLAAYLDAVEPVLPVAPGDRLSQTFALTFDLSVHDMFVALSNSATLVVPTHDELQDPADYINERRITHWFSVPSLAYQMRLRGALREKAFPSLRSVLFCGEILSWELGGTGSPQHRMPG